MRATCVPRSLNFSRSVATQSFTFREPSHTNGSQVISITDWTISSTDQPSHTKPFCSTTVQVDTNQPSTDRICWFQRHKPEPRQLNKHSASGAPLGDDNRRGYLTGSCGRPVHCGSSEATPRRDAAGSNPVVALASPGRIYSGTHDLRRTSAQLCR